jgi:hypothetical protein
MQEELILKAIAQAIAALVLVTILIMLLLVLRKDVQGRRPLNRSTLFAVVMLGLWSFFALAEAYASFRQVFSFEPPSSASTTQHGRTNIVILPILQRTVYGGELP